MARKRKNPKGTTKRAIGLLGAGLERKLQEVDLDRWKAKLEDALDDLGASSAEVAASLSTSGCVGEIKSPCRCPVARFLVSKRNFKWVYVSPKKVVFESGQGFQAQVRTPAVIQDFLLRFDRGCYPQLVRRDS